MESRKASKEDLKYDTQEFLRKLEWKAHFHENPKDDSFNEDQHQALRIPSRKHPEGLISPLMDEIRTKLLGFVSSFNPSQPVTNLTAAERRGKSWVLNAIEEEKIFITKADKGGATLILDYTVAVDCVIKELSNQENFEHVDLAIDNKMKEVQLTVRCKVLELLTDGVILEKDKTLITGLNKNNNLMHSHVFKPVVPYYMYTHYSKSINFLKNKSATRLRHLLDWYTLHARAPSIV